MTREAMDAFHRVLAKVGEGAVGLPLSLFDLHAFVTPLAKVHADGRVSYGGTGWGGGRGTGKELEGWEGTDGPWMGWDGRRKGLDGNRGTGKKGTGRDENWRMGNDGMGTVWDQYGTETGTEWT